MEYFDCKIEKKGKYVDYFLITFFTFLKTYTVFPAPVMFQLDKGK